MIWQKRRKWIFGIVMKRNNTTHSLVTQVMNKKYKQNNTTHSSCSYKYLWNWNSYLYKWYFELKTSMMKLMILLLFIFWVVQPEKHACGFFIYWESICNFHVQIFLWINYMTCLSFVHISHNCGQYNSYTMYVIRFTGRDYI